MSRTLIDLAGKKFGAWTAIRYVGMNGYKQASWACVCDCGTERNVVARTLRDGSSVGCGCTKREILRKVKTKHGGCGSRTYSSWCSMISRCRSTKPKVSRYYNSVGVSVCERWHVFENFLADMGERPPGRMSIDRYPDKYGIYEPGNCRWATDTEQANNHRPRRRGYKRRSRAAS